MKTHQPPDQSPPSILSKATELYAGSTIVSVDPQLLKPHPVSLRVFGLGSPEKNASLAQDVKQNGVTDPVVACGDNCFSPRDTILAGHRRADAARSAGRLVPVIYRDNLNEDDETIIIVQSNLAGEHRRTLTEEQKYQAEETLRGIIGKRQGERTDLATFVSSDTSSVAQAQASTRKPTTRQQVAKVVGESEAAIGQRQIIFGSPVSPPELKAAVTEKRISRDKGAKLVRTKERALNASKKQTRDTAALHDYQEEAKAQLAQETKAVLSQTRTKPRDAHQTRTSTGASASGAGNVERKEKIKDIKTRLTDVEIQVAGLLDAIDEAIRSNTRACMQKVTVVMMNMQGVVDDLGRTPDNANDNIAEASTDVERNRAQIASVKDAAQKVADILGPVESGVLREAVEALVAKMQRA